MDYWQVMAYIEAAERDRGEKLVQLMNVMAVAFGGSPKDRKGMANSLLGRDTAEFDVNSFESLLMGNLATPVEAENNEAKDWASGEFDRDDPAFKVK